MNHIIYAKKDGEKRYGAMNLQDGSYGVGLLFATLISDLDKAKGYADKLASDAKGFSFQVRVAGTGKVVYTGIAKKEAENL